MIFGEEVEFEDENIKADYHQFIMWSLGRVPKTETSELDIIGMCTSNFLADKMRLFEGICKYIFLLNSNNYDYKITPFR